MERVAYSPRPDVGDVRTSSGDGARSGNSAIVAGDGVVVVPAIAAEEVEVQAVTTAWSLGVPAACAVAEPEALEAGSEALPTPWRVGASRASLDARREANEDISR